MGQSSLLLLQLPKAECNTPGRLPAATPGRIEGDLLNTLQNQMIATTKGIISNYLHELHRTRRP